MRFLQNYSWEKLRNILKVQNAITFKTKNSITYLQDSIGLQNIEV
jgi:hypothetical protein